MADANFSLGDLPAQVQEPEKPQIEEQDVKQDVVPMEETIEEPVFSVRSSIVQSLVEVTADLLDVFWDSEDGPSRSEENLSEKPGAEGEGHPKKSESLEVIENPMIIEEAQGSVLLVGTSEASPSSQEYTEDDLTPCQGSKENTDIGATSGTEDTVKETPVNNWTPLVDSVSAEKEHSDTLLVVKKTDPDLASASGLNLSDNNLEETVPKEMNEEGNRGEENEEEAEDDAGSFRTSRTEIPQSQSSHEPGISGIQGAEPLNRLAAFDQMFESKDELDVCDPDLDESEQFQKPLEEALRQFLESQVGEVVKSESEFEVEVPILRGSSVLKDPHKEQFPLHASCVNSEDDEDRESLITDFSEGSMQDIHLDTVDLTEPDEEEVLEYCVKNTKVIEMRLNPDVPSEVSIINYTPIVQNSDTSTQDGLGNAEQDEPANEPSRERTEPKYINIIPTDYSSDSESTQALASTNASSHTAFEDRPAVVDNVDSSNPESRDTSATTLNTSTDSDISGTEAVESSSAESHKIDFHATNSAHDNGFRYSWDRSNASQICQRPGLTFRVEIRKLNFPIDISAQINKEETPRKTEIRKLRYPWNEKQSPPIDDANILDDFPEVAQELDLKEKNLKSEDETELEESLSQEIDTIIDSTSSVGISNEPDNNQAEHNSTSDFPTVIHPENVSLYKELLGATEKHRETVQEVEWVCGLNYDCKQFEDQETGIDSAQAANVDNNNNNIERSSNHVLADTDSATIYIEERASASNDDYHKQTDVQSEQNGNSIHINESNSSNIGLREPLCEINFDCKESGAHIRYEGSTDEKDEKEENRINEVPSELKTVSKQSVQQSNQLENRSSNNSPSKSIGNSEGEDNIMEPEGKNSHLLRDLVYVQRMGFTCLKLGPAAIFSSTTSPTAPVDPELLEDLAQVTGQSHYKKLIQALGSGNCPTRKEYQEQKLNEDETRELSNNVTTTTDENREADDNLQNNSVHSMVASNETNEDISEQIENIDSSAYKMHTDYFDLLDLPPKVLLERNRETSSSVGTSNTSCNDTPMDVKENDEESGYTQNLFPDMENNEVDNPDSGYDTMVNLSENDDPSDSSVNIKPSESHKPSTCIRENAVCSINVSSESIETSLENEEQHTINNSPLNSVYTSTETVGEWASNDIDDDDDDDDEEEEDKQKMQYDPENLRTAVIVAQNTEANILKIINVLMQAQEMEENLQNDTKVTDDIAGEINNASESSGMGDDLSNVHPQDQTLSAVVKDFIDSQFRQHEFVADEPEVNLHESVTLDGMNNTVSNAEYLSSQQNSEGENLKIHENEVKNCASSEISSVAVENNTYLDNVVPTGLIKHSESGGIFTVEKPENEVSNAGKSVTEICPISQEIKETSSGADLQIIASDTHSEIRVDNEEKPVVSFPLEDETVFPACKTNVPADLVVEEDICKRESNARLTQIGEEDDSVTNSGANTAENQIYPDIDEDLYRGDDDVPFPQQKAHDIFSVDSSEAVENRTYADIEEAKYRDWYKGKDIDTGLGEASRGYEYSISEIDQCEIQDLGNSEEHRINVAVPKHNISTASDVFELRNDGYLNALEKLEITERFLESLEKDKSSNRIEGVDFKDETEHTEPYEIKNDMKVDTCEISEEQESGSIVENCSLETGTENVCSIKINNTGEELGVNNLDTVSAEEETSAVAVEEVREVLQNNSEDECGKDLFGTVRELTPEDLQAMKQTVREYQKLVENICSEMGKDIQKEQDIEVNHEIDESPVDSCRYTDDAMESSEDMSMSMQVTRDTDPINLKIQRIQEKPESISQDADYQALELNEQEDIPTRTSDSIHYTSSGFEILGPQSQMEFAGDIGGSDLSAGNAGEPMNFSVGHYDHFENVKDESKEREYIEIIGELDLQACAEGNVENKMVNFESNIVDSREDIGPVDELKEKEADEVGSNVEIPKEFLFEGEDEELDEGAIVTAQCQDIVEEIISSVEGGCQMEPEDTASETELIVENKWSDQPFLQCAQSRWLPIFGRSFSGSFLYRTEGRTSSASSFLNWDAGVGIEEDVD